MLTKKTPRKEIFLNLLKYPLKIFLYRLAKKNLEEHEQLSIYSSDFIGLNIIVDRLYEKRYLKIVDEWIKNFHKEVYNGVCLEIGANIGNHSLFYCKKFNKVISFEVFQIT